MNFYIISSIYISCINSFKIKKKKKFGFFHVTKTLKETKILFNKIIENIEETLPSKSLFHSFRYLDPLPRYEESNFS